jgi:hypothetical protein
MVAAQSFPGSANIGDYVLRTDYSPNRIFRYDGRRWVKVEDLRRSDLTRNSDSNETQRERFIRSHDTYVGTDGRTHPERQSLSRGLTPEADN